jgi:hypothetical protein
MTCYTILLQITTIAKQIVKYCELSCTIYLYLCHKSSFVPGTDVGVHIAAINLKLRALAIKVLSEKGHALAAAASL